MKMKCPCRANKECRQPCLSNKSQRSLLKPSLKMNFHCFQATPSKLTLIIRLDDYDEEPDLNFNDELLKTDTDT